MLHCSTVPAAWLFVAAGSQPMAGHGVVMRGHLVDAARVNPAIVEIKEAANQDGIVDRLVGETMLVKRVDVFLGHGGTVAVHLFDVGQERFLRVWDRRRPVISENRVYDTTVPQQFRRNCGVAADSKRAAIQL